MELKDSVSTLKGIGPKKEESLNKSKIYTLEDFLYFFPRKYEDRRNSTPISGLRVDEERFIKGVVEVKNYKGGQFRKKALLKLQVSDGTGLIEIVFFNGRFITNNFKKGEEYCFYGKVSESMGMLQMVHPDFGKPGSSEFQGVIPVYPSIQGISQREIRTIQTSLKPLWEELEEWLPEDIVRENNLADPAYAVSNIHFPDSGYKVSEGKYRLVFDELLTLETGLMYIKGYGANADGIRISCNGCNEFEDSLKFQLTKDQKSAWEDIKRDLQAEGAMNRLIQGDVGSGKTVIAQLSMFAAYKDGYQSVIMAPTELLTKQHYELFKGEFEPFGIKVGLLCSSMKAAEKRAVIEGLERGDIDILAATHAVLQDNVTFSNLGLVITDEQHRFGVNQRKILSAKGENPNILVMTATPIPRTLAVILYGDLDVSQIRTMPKGRKPIKTYNIQREERRKVYSFVSDQVKQGRQAYVVAPLIEESDKIDAISAENLYAQLSKVFVNARVELIHGAMSQDDKDRIMDSFARGDVDILVSTVVIEVGINVANATVMVIENAERFGLAQLHQLRGRVGRGEHQSYCFLISNNQSEKSNDRMQVLCRSNDGFEIAEQDLLLRGPGEIFGTRQHGIPELRVSDLIRHNKVLIRAQKVAKEIITEDPKLELEKYRPLKERVKKTFGEDIRLDL